MTDTVGESSGRGQQPHPPRSPSPPTARVVEIIELLSAASPPTSDPSASGLSAPTLADIVRRTGQSRATTHAIITELIDRGWVARAADGTLGPGMGLITLAGAIARTDRLAVLAGPALGELGARVDIGCFLARRVGDQIRIIEHAGPSDWKPVGGSMAVRPPVCREFIAWAGAQERATWISAAPPPLRTRLTMALDAVRARGVSIERMTDDIAAVMSALDSLAGISDAMRSQIGEFLGGLTTIDYLPEEIPDDPSAEVAVATIGAPVFDAHGRVIASVVCCPGGSVSVAELDRLSEQVRATAAGLSDGSPRRPATGQQD